MNGSRATRRGLALIALIALGGGSMTVGLDTPTSVAAASAGAIARATQVDLRLNLPVPSNRSVTLIADRDSGQQISEVIDLGATGSPVAISRFDSGGQLLSLVRLGFGTQTGSGIGSGQASERASTILASLGLTTAGPAAVTPRASGGWLVRWVRTVGGVPVPGDGVSVQLGLEGSFQAVVRTEHRIAPAPAVPLDASYVRLVAQARLDRWLAAGVRGQASVGPPSLAWVAPNDTFGDAVPTDRPGELRLAWIVRVTTSGSLAEQVAGIELAFDAGDGTALGGDLLE